MPDRNRGKGYRLRKVPKSLTLKMRNSIRRRSLVLQVNARKTLEGILKCERLTEGDMAIRINAR